MDFILEKACELGAARILPALSARTVVRPNETQGVQRTERWRRIVVNAARQCGAAWLPDVEAPAPLMTTLETVAAMDLFLVGSLAPEAPSLRDVLGRARTRDPREVALLIGPEGDLTEEELRCATRAGAAPVSFGPRVLRVDTAALYGLAALAYEFLTDVGDADPAEEDPADPEAS